MIALTANFGSVVEGLAAADAYMALDTNTEYWDAVIDYAFLQANTEFNEMAAAYAKTGAIKHMFEWGTLGVNTQATNVRPRATEERARLWEAIMINTGPRGGVTVDFAFKPSTALVPISTSVPASIRALMRRHVFEWKARVMEEGLPVKIARKDAQFLLIPDGPKMTGFRPSDVARGYTLTLGPITAVPGRKVAGTFSAFWANYWNSRGPETLGAVVETELDEDFLPYFADTKGTESMNVNIIEAVRMRSQELQKEVAAKAKARQRNVQ